MGAFSIWHLLILLVVVVLLFGTKKIRNIGADLGSAVKGFKDGMSGSAEADKKPDQLADKSAVDGEVKDKQKSS
ncbi:MAG: Sec-independent protein translocase subunit TatA [Betaproteobacteria bacterium]|nr:Sec-independent protein translocase subunit TatA [Betaproteobacteria bacterium]